jgi:hypothetical protein
MIFPITITRPFVITQYIYLKYNTITCALFLNRIRNISVEIKFSLSNVLILSVPDEGYSRNAPCALN